LKRLLLVVAALFAAWLLARHLGVADALSLDALKARQAALQARVAAEPLALHHAARAPPQLEPCPAVQP
jgi:hypothetical protein